MLFSSHVTVAPGSEIHLIRHWITVKKLQFCQGKYINVMSIEIISCILSCKLDLDSLIIIIENK